MPKGTHAVARAGLRKMCIRDRSNSVAVRAAAMFPMRIMGLATPVIAVAMILSEGLFGAGSTKFVAGAQFLLVFGWLVPGAYFLGVERHMALNGIWIAAFGYSCLAAVVKMCIRDRAKPPGQARSVERSSRAHDRDVPPSVRTPQSNV